jgi:hypothetical protein
MAPTPPPQEPQKPPPKRESPLAIPTVGLGKDQVMNISLN